MKKGTKIALYSIGGLVVAGGLFLGFRAIVKAIKSTGGGNVPPPPPPTSSNPVNPPQEPNIRGGLFPMGLGSRGDHVLALQKAMNKKWGDDWCSWSKCQGGLYKDPIEEDGVFGEQTALYINCHYPETDCAKCPFFGKGSTFPIGPADYDRCYISYSKFKSIVGSKVAEKYKDFSGSEYSNANGGNRANTHYKGNCCEWCQDLSMGRAIGNVPPEGCYDWMCGNPEWCPGTKPLVPGRPSGRPVASLGFDGAVATNNILRGKK